MSPLRTTWRHHTPHFLTRQHPFAPPFAPPWPYAGIDPAGIPAAVRDVVEDAKTWVEVSAYGPDELAVRFHHRLVPGMQATAGNQAVLRAFKPTKPGQERHLPHEAWHVVQQKQGKVKPYSGTGPLPAETPALAAEADRMGAKAEAEESGKESETEES